MRIARAVHACSGYRSLTRKSATGLLALSLAVLLCVTPRPPAASAQTQSGSGSYQFVDLGNLGGNFANATDLNDSDQVVGYSWIADGTQHAFLWQNGRMTDLGVLPGNLNSFAYGINNLGAIVGESGTATVNQFTAFVWRNGTMTSLGYVPPDTASVAYSINDSGEVVGYTSTYPATAPLHPFYYDGSMHALPQGPGPSAQALDVNKNGDIVGWSENVQSGACNGPDGNWCYEAVAWSGGTMHQLLTAAQAGTGSSKATRLNDSGTTIGNGMFKQPDGSYQFCVFTGDLSAVSPFSNCAISASPCCDGDTDINDKGVMIAGDSPSQLIENGVITPITQLAQFPTGASSINATAINNNGDICGIYFLNSVRHAFLLTKTPVVPDPQTDGPPGSSPLASNPTGTAAEPVNTATGSYMTSVTDLQLPGVGVPFQFTRTYNSGDSTTGSLGLGWSDTLDWSALVQPSGDVDIRSDTGQQLYFTRQSDGTFTPDPGGRSTLTATGGGYELVTHDQTHYIFDSQGRLTSEKDRNGSGLTLAYDANGLSSVTDSAGRTITVTTTGGLITEVALPDGRNVQLGYTGSLLTSVTDARGGTTVYGYDPGNRLATIRDQNQTTLVTNTYDQTTGRITQQQDARGGISHFDWDPATQTATFTDARGKLWKDVYSDNVLLKRIDPLGNTTNYTWNGQLELAQITDPRTHATSMTYDSAGNMLTRSAPAPFTFSESWTYDSFNDVKTHTDGRGNTTTYGYDSAGNLTTITGPDPDGSGPLTAPVTTYTRDPSTHLITAVQDPRLKTTQYGYDADHNLASVRTPLGDTTTMHYDASGRLDSLVEPRGNATGADPNQYKWLYTYNPSDQLLTQTDPLGNTTTFTYDPAGRLESKEDANNQTTSYTYWPSGQVKTVTAPDPDGAGPLTAPITSYTYDPTGNLLTRTDADQNVTTYGYDDAGRQTSMQTQLGNLWTYGYDANGNLSSVLDANHGTTTYGYDNLNRLTSIAYSDSTPSVSFTYDEDNNRKTMADGGGSVSYSYDNLNRLTNVTRGSSTFSYTYDADGNVTQRTYPDTTVFTYGYDDDGRMQSTTNSSVGTTTYGYDAAGNLLATTLPATNGYVESRTYDRAGRLTEVKDAKGAATLTDFTQTLDADGDPLTVTRAGSTSSTRSYTYDNMDRLTAVCFQSACPNSSDPKISWTYDGVGNRLTETRSYSATTYSYDGDNRLTQAVATPGLNPYSQQATLDGAQPYRRFAETGGTYFASSVGSYTGTWTGSPTLGVPGALNSDPNGAVTLDGSTQYGTVANNTQLSKTNNFSIELWVKRSKTAASQAVVGKPLTTTTKSENYALWFDTSNKIRFEVGGGGAKFATVTSAAALDSNWHHIVATFASGVMKLYVDGSQSATVTASFTSANTNSSTLDIGRAGTANYYGGSLDELAVYGTALGATQVADHYSKGSGTPAASTTSYGYDSDGQQTSAGANTFAWNLDKTVRSATVGGATTTYAYDGDGNQLSATIGSNVTNEAWDTNYALPQLALERNGSNGLIRRYMIGQQTAAMTTSAGNFFYHYDPLGSVSNLTDASGNTQWTYGYEPFGSQRTAIQGVQSPPTNSLLFQSQYLDPTTNLYNLRARQYDPTIGRFLSTDPVTPPATVAYESPYAYANDQPTMLIDPSGKATIGLCLGGSITALFIHAQGSVCLVTTSNFSIGVTGTGGAGISPLNKGLDVSGNVSEQVSSGNCVGDLAHRFYTAGGSAGIGGGVTGEGFIGPGHSNQTVGGGSLGEGFNLGAEVHGGATYTVTKTLIGKGCSSDGVGVNGK